MTAEKHSENARTTAILMEAGISLQRQNLKRRHANTNEKDDSDDWQPVTCGRRGHPTDVSSIDHGTIGRSVSVAASHRKRRVTGAPPATRKSARNGRPDRGDVTASS
jgi:hypothetical protein